MKDRKYKFYSKQESMVFNSDNLCINQISLKKDFNRGISKMEFGNIMKLAIFHLRFLVQSG